MLRKECVVLLAHVVGKGAEGPKLKDIPEVMEHPEVFPDDLLELFPQRQVEFHIDLIPDVASVANAL